MISYTQQMQTMLARIANQMTLREECLHQKTPRSMGKSAQVESHRLLRMTQALASMAEAAELDWESELP